MVLVPNGRHTCEAFADWPVCFGPFFAPTQTGQSAGSVENRRH